ncbi:MAG: hypothetical protein H0X65_05660 [Gemmatimonadetes bacterium]|nr:hypothetical protein [Gemmatimonadota bacterium]
MGAALLVLSACASAPQASTSEARRAELLSAQASQPGRSCYVVDTPEELPAADVLVDSAALVRDLATLPRTEQDSAGYVLLSMGYDRFGANIRRAVIEHDVSTAAADSVQKLVFNHRRAVEEGEAQGDWGVRLRIDLDGSPHLQVGRQERCAPRPRDSALAMAMQTTHGTGTRYRGGVRESTVWVRLFVSPQGTVTGAALERGFVQGAMMEQRILDYVRSIFFEPAREDGFPSSGTITIPLTVRQR